MGAFAKLRNLIVVDHNKPGIFLNKKSIKQKIGAREGEEEICGINKK